ncbi:hypothetical protein K438DRAFT_2030796 [Mycena galopus ATCC 62051]|nr:hypothetical protein K438DRAFT_2030796 [Mycena galopus ATCC 62051]
MAVTFPHSLPMQPYKRSRRTATTVLAGDFDVRPSRDVLTSLLNGVGPYTPLLRLDDDEIRRQHLGRHKGLLARAPVYPHCHHAAIGLGDATAFHFSASPSLHPGFDPGPSNSSSTSRTSSKRPRTPDDYEDFLRSTHEEHQHRSPVPRKPRAAAKKGWKGWVEGSPPPSEKLINLDAVPVLQERRTRSGKNFDAIGVGKDGWV